MSSTMAGLSAFREQYVKSFEYPAIVLLLITVLISLVLYLNQSQHYFHVKPGILLPIYLLIIAGLAFIYLKPDVNSFILPERLTLDANHFIISIIALLAGIYTWLTMQKEQPGSLTTKIQTIFLIIALISGVLMMIKFDLIYQIVRVAYTVFDLSVVFSICISVIWLIKNQFRTIETTFVPWRPGGKKISDR
jgi:uncharacterized membrane protein